MWGRAWSALVGAVVVTGCLDIKPFHDAAVVTPDAPDCNPNDPDSDGDLWRCDNARAPDCHDGNPNINPGALDVPGNGMDEDCTGGDRTMSTVAVSVSGNDVATGPYTMRFSSTGNRLPDRITLTGDSTQLLYTGTGCTITSEEMIGVSIYPAFSSHARSPGQSATQITEASGPAMARITVDVTGMYTCDDGAPINNTPVIRIELGLFPDGRIVRHDEVNPRVVPQAASCMPVTPCTDQAGNHFIVTSSYAFRDPDDGTDAFTHWEAPDNGVTFASIPPMTTAGQENGVAGIDSWHCLVNQQVGYGVGIMWSPTTAFGTRLRRAYMAPFDASVLDWQRSPSSLIDMTLSANSTLVFFTNQDPPATNCTGMDGLLLPYTLPGLGGNNIDRRTGVMPLTMPATNQVELSPNQVRIHGVVLPASMAFEVPIASATGVTVWLNGNRVEAGLAYQVQRTASQSYIVWFPIGFLPSDEIVIAGPGGEPPQP